MIRLTLCLRVEAARYISAFLSASEKPALLVWFAQHYSCSLRVGIALCISALCEYRWETGASCIGCSALLLCFRAEITCVSDLYECRWQTGAAPPRVI